MKTKKFSSMRTFTVGKYEVCVFPGGGMTHIDRSGETTGSISLDLLMKEKPEDEDRARMFFKDWWNCAYDGYADLEEKIALWMYAEGFYGLQVVKLYNIGIRKAGQIHGVMMDESTITDGKYVSVRRWVSMDSLLDFRDKYSDADNEFLDRIEDEVQRIGKGYDCNFRHHGENIHHINGANHFCFSLEGDKVHPLAVGGSRFCYPSDFTREEFIEKLPNILLTDEECNAAYRGIWNEMTK